MSSGQQICNILKVDPLNENRCCGLRKDGQPCNNIVAIASRQSAHRTFLKCANLPSTSRRLHDNFGAAASLLLCKRWHQNQWSAVVDDWLKSWADYQDRADSGYGSESESEEEEIRYERPRHAPRSSSAQASGQRNIGATRTNAQPSAYEDLVLAILNSDISNDAKVSILQSTTPTNRRDNNHESGGGRSRDNNNGGTGSRHTSQRSDPSISQLSSPLAMPSGSSRSRSHTANISISTSSSSSNAGSLSTPSTPTSSSAPSPITPTPISPPPRVRRSNRPSAQAATPHHSPLRDSHLECRICFESYDNRTDGFWECRQCQNRVHMDCHQLWCTSSGAPSTLISNPRVKCVYCRTVVPSS